MSASAENKNNALMRNLLNNNKLRNIFNLKYYNS